MHLRLLAIPLLVLLLLTAACRPSGPSIAELDMRDMTTAYMFEQLAQGLKQAYLLELPSEGVSPQLDLVLKGVRQRDVLIELVRLDPAWQYVLHENVSLYFPAGKVGEASPFSKRLETFQAQGGASDVVHQLMLQAGLADTTIIQASVEGARRPVSLDAKDKTLREILAEVAVQAHVGMRNEPGYIRMFELP